MQLICAFVFLHMKKAGFVMTQLMLSYDVTVIQWITSFDKDYMTTRYIIPLQMMLVRMMQFFVEIVSTLKEKKKTF